MFDIKAIEDEVNAELNEERAVIAKTKIKSHLARIATAEKVVENLRFEYKVLVADLATTV